MKWNYRLIFAFLLLLLSQSLSFGSQGIYLTASQTMQLKLNLMTLKDLTKNQELKLTESERQLETAKQQLTESEKENQRLENQLNLLNQQLEKHIKTIEEQKQSLMTASKSLKQQKRKNNAVVIGLLSVIVGISILK